ncbi:hypothetical protein [Flaviaesturariibacter aridisoli]|nr:hypothetical protein [Flaviaesturariibacter aridisoli]
MQIKKLLALIVVAILIMVVLFLINSQFDTFKDPAEMQEYTEN